MHVLHSSMYTENDTSILDSSNTEMARVKLEVGKLSDINKEYLQFTISLTHTKHLTKYNIQNNIKRIKFFQP